MTGKLALYLDLIRWNRPAGWLLLLWPSLAALWVAAGMGVTLVPRLSVPKEALQASAKRKKSADSYVRYLPVVDGDDAPPTRRVVLAWRRSFTRYEAIAALRNAIYASDLPGVQRLT